jgi:ERCC4-type nuclease
MLLALIGLNVGSRLPERWFVVDVLTITVDVRERRSGVPEWLAALGVTVELVTLAVGDYAFGDRVIERKTIADLHRSLRDRRIWGQVAALRRDPRRAYLLVEGVDLDDGTVPPRALRGALLKVTDNGIRILRTTSQDDSALWLHVFAAQEHRRLTQPAEVHVGRRPIVASPVGLLSQFRGSAWITPKR